MYGRMECSDCCTSLYAMRLTAITLKLIVRIEQLNRTLLRMQKRFRISYWFAPLRVTAPKMDYADFKDALYDLGLISDRTKDSAQNKVEKVWPAVKEYLWQRIEDIIMNDPEIIRIVLKVLENGDR